MCGIEQTRPLINKEKINDKHMCLGEKGSHPRSQTVLAQNKHPVSQI